MVDPNPESKDRPTPPRTPLRRFSSEALFEGRGEVIIDHHGEEYRLRVTKSGKLILTK